MSLYTENSVLEEVFTVALEQNNLKNLTESIAKLLKNPIAVYDTSYYILAHSSVKLVEDAIWLEGMKRGYCRYEYAAKLSKLAKSTEDTGVQIVTDFGKLRRRQACLTINSSTIGYIAVLESDTLLESIPNQYYQIAASLLAKELSITHTSGGTSTHSNYHNIIMHLLNNSFANRMLFRQRISGSELDINTTFRLLTIDTEAFSASSDGVQMRSILEGFLPFSWSVFHNQHIIILLNFDHPYYQNPETRSAFVTYLKENHLRCCISDAFDDLFILKEHYSLNVSALQLARSCRDTRAFITYDEYKLFRSIQMIPREEIPFLCSFAILEIRESDQLNKTEYFQTVFCYLHTGRSLQKTAELLFLHRNTVAYRIQKISEKYSIDFKNELQVLQHYYSCLLLQAADHDNRFTYF